MPTEVLMQPLGFAARGIILGDIEPLIDGNVPSHADPEVSGDKVTWRLDQGIAILEIKQGEITRLHFRLEGFPAGHIVGSLGLRFSSVAGIRSYLRNGYQSWDGSFFVEPGTPTGDGPPAKAPTLGLRHDCVTARRRARRVGHRLRPSRPVPVTTAVRRQRRRSDIRHRNAARWHRA